MKLTCNISKFLGIPESTVVKWSYDVSYQQLFIPKKSGQGKRHISVPNQNLKLIQYSLVNILFDNDRLFPIHPIAVAYRRGVSSPIKNAVALHAGLPYSVKVDMKNFFPSIKFEDFYHTLKNIDLFSIEENLDLIARCCFLGRSSLAIGAPSSPIISNIIMYEIDCELDLYAKAKEACITRYADDIVFSSKNKTDCREFHKVLQDILSSKESPFLSLNHAKTRFMSRASSRRILGINITPEGALSVGREKKRLIRAMVHQNAHLDSSQQYYLSGYLNYLCDVEPSFIRALEQKYTPSLINSLRRYNGEGNGTPNPST